VQRAGQGARPQVELAFDRLVTASGRSYVLHGRVIGMHVQTRNNAGREVIGAVGGMVLGNILGKAVGTNAGGLLGAGGGFLYAKNYHTNVSVPAGSTVNVQVTRVARQA
jgi:outer membrane lipoprotein SlyB